MTTISYNGQTTEVALDKLATCACNGQLMKSDIVITSGDCYLILTYGGGEKHLEENKTMTLQCKDHIAESDLTVDTKHCKIAIYADDDITEISWFTIVPDVTVTVTGADSNGVGLRFSPSPYGGDTYSNTYAADTTIMAGVAIDPHYYFSQYLPGDSFTLTGHKTHKIYLRAYKTEPYYYVVIHGTGKWVDYNKFSFERGETEVTWEEWVDCSKNEIGAYISNGNVYMDNGKKVLYDSNNVLVKSTDMLVVWGEYTFNEV